jgi:hypothetical protein
MHRARSAKDLKGGLGLLVPGLQELEALRLSAPLWRALFPPTTVARRLGGVQYAQLPALTKSLVITLLPARRGVGARRVLAESRADGKVVALGYCQGDFSGLPLGDTVNGCIFRHIRHNWPVAIQKRPRPIAAERRRLCLTLSLTIQY